MNEIHTEETLDSAAARLERALNVLESSVRNLNGRLRSQARVEADTNRLVAERAKLAADLDKASARAKRLDDSAHEVSVRLVEAMETVRSVLQK